MRRNKPADVPATKPAAEAADMPSAKTTGGVTAAEPARVSAPATLRHQSRHHCQQSRENRDWKNPPHSAILLFF